MKSIYFGMGLILFARLSCFNALHAQIPQTESDTVRLEEVVITGAKIDVARNNVPMTVSVIDEKQIRESSESALLPVLSQQVPGVFITQRGITGFGVATGAAGGIRIRGIGGSPNTQVLVLLNGNPQYMGIMGHPLPDSYVASDVEKVEIIRGPASTLYGSNAMGGVINIVTKTGKENGFNVNGRLMYGSYDTRKFMMNGGYKKGKFNVFASVNHDQTDGHRDSSEFRINNGYINAGYRVNDHLSSRINFSLAEFIASDPGPENGTAGEMIDITRGMGAVSLYNTFDSSSGSIRFFYNFGEHDITDGFHSLDRNYGVIAYQSFRLFKGNSITAGMDYKNFGGLAENIYAMNGIGVVLGDTMVHELAGYVYIQQFLWKKLIFNTGFRIEQNSAYGREPVPSVGLAYHFSPASTVKAAIAKGFRSPTIRELYLFPPANENLRPERMMSYELGFLQDLFKDKLSIELTGYQVNGENMILTILTNEGPKNENTGSFTNLGLEFSATYFPVENFTFMVNYSYISMKTPVLATPEQQLNMNGTYRYRKFTLNLSTQYIGNLYTRTNPEISRESYLLLHSRLSVSVNRFWDVFLKGENLTNRSYSINSGYPMPGITGFAGINFHL